MPTSAPALRIAISLKEFLVVTLTTPTDRHEVVTSVSPQSLDDLLYTLYSGLDRFWQLVDLELTVASYYRASKALVYLHGLGAQLNRQLFGDGRYEVEKFVRKACPTWRQSGSEGYVPPLVEVTTGSDHVLPFEFIPFFDTTKPDIENKDELTLKQELPQLAARFLGFSTIVYRKFLQFSGPAAETIENLPRMSLRFFQHAGLEGAREDKEFFTAAKWLDLRGPWPEQSLEEGVFVSSLAAQLWNAATLSLNPGQSTDEIQHFSCHCDTEQQHSASYSLLLAHKRDRWGHNSLRRATIGNLEREFGVYDERPSGITYPLVFLNACGSSKLTSNGVSSFPKLFLRMKGNRGVVGTETSIPDVFASAFSRKFYLNLIHGATLGEAMFQTTWRLLKQYKNPLGILYTIYADPELKVRRPIPDAVG